MNYFFIIFTSLNVFIIADTQRIHYANRFRNISLESETGDMYLVNATIIQERLDHVLMGIINVTRDIRMKKGTILIHRCSFEKADCENFMEWVFPIGGIKHFMFMKNQLWTPMFTNLSPRFDFPVMKKGVYQMNKITIDAKAALAFYPEATKYYWRGVGKMYDNKERKVATAFMETTFFIFVDRGRNREGGGSKSKPDDNWE